MKEHILSNLEASIHDDCHAVALKHMDESDYILISDANGKLGENITRNKDGYIYTLKQSSLNKYRSAYSIHLDKLITNLMWFLNQ